MVYFSMACPTVVVYATCFMVMYGRQEDCGLNKVKGRGICAELFAVLIKLLSKSECFLAFKSSRMLFGKYLLISRLDSLHVSSNCHFLLTSSTNSCLDCEL